MFKRKIMSFISFVVIVLLLTQTVFAASPTENGDMQQIAENMEILENTLSTNNTDVVSELNDLIKKYSRRAVSAATTEEAEKLNNLITTLQELIVEYQLYTSGNTTYKFHLIYSPSVATVIAYFNMQNYLLAAELLTHAKDNTEYLSAYSPNYGARARNSSVTEQIGYGTAVSGSSAFEKGESTYEMDLYYAIHAFDFFKSSPTSRVVVIFDVYDFKHEENAYQSIAGVAIETMYKAQEAGVIVPFYTVIEVAV